MHHTDKYAARWMRSKAYADYARVVEETFKRFMTTPVDVFACLTEARLNEKNAVCAERLRETLRLEEPQADPPAELSSQAVAKYYLQAARMYEAAATYAVLLGDLCRAFKRFRKAAKCGQRCNELLACGDPEILAAVKDYREKTALIRGEIARRSVRRRRLTFGLGRRLR